MMTHFFVSSFIIVGNMKDTFLEVRRWPGSYSFYSGRGSLSCFYSEVLYMMG